MVYLVRCYKCTKLKMILKAAIYKGYKKVSPTVETAGLK